jgi:nitrogen fixation protein NifU and related proteins
VLDALYQDEIIQLSRKSRERGRLEAPDASARVDNPLCGDRVTMDLAITDGRISAIGHRVRGCALCEAAAEIISETAIGLDIRAMPEIEAAARRFMTTPSSVPPWAQLSIFEPVRDVKSRHDCVYLPFTAMNKAISEAGGGS